MPAHAHTQKHYIIILELGYAFFSSIRSDKGRCRDGLLSCFFFFVYFVCTNHAAASLSFMLGRTCRFFFVCFFV